MDEYHPDLRHECDERANAELHAELERNCYEALRKVRNLKAMLIMTKDEWSALLYSCGFKASDFE